LPSRASPGRSHPAQYGRSEQNHSRHARSSRAWVDFYQLVDFDAKFGHRNNPASHANALVEFDQRLREIMAALAKDDVLVITADHGNDPTIPGTDHTREYVPVLITGAAIRLGANIGARATFADLAATIAETMSSTNVERADVVRQPAGDGPSWPF
jgi:phosphopentomutase